MARRSSIEQLPPDVLEKLQELLRDPRVTQLEVTAEINKALEAAGHDDRVSKSAVNRYAMRMEEVGRELRESREMAEMWIAKLGTAPAGKVGQLVNEILRTLAFDVTIAIKTGQLDPDDAPAVAKMVKDLSVAMEKLERAASDNVRREKELRREAAEDAANKAAEAAKKSGMSDKAVSDIRREILGIDA